VTSRKKAAEDTLERPLPHNLDAERSVLGGILISNEAYTRVVGRLRPEDFYRDAHRRIYAALERLLERHGGSADFITLQDALVRANDLDTVGGPAYLAALTDGVPRATNVPHYAAIVRDKAQLRRVIRTADELLAAAYNDAEPADEILERADRDIVRLRHGAGPSRMRSIQAASSELIADLEWRADHRGELLGIDTGFASINELTNGWQPGDLVVVAARPSIGKTTWLMNSAEAAARSGKRVAIFSLEMRRKQLEYRLLSSIAGVDLSNVVSGYMSDAEWELVTKALTEVCSWPLYIDDTAARTVWDIRAECRRLQADGGLDLVIVDYVQLMAADKPSPSGNRNAEITDISRKLKIMADELSCPVLLASQLNRASELRSDPRPKLSDLRESGALEQDADTVCFLHRKHHRENGTTQFILEKQRNGPGGTVNLTVCREIVRFTDGGDDPEPEPEPKREPKMHKPLLRPRR
jgi:replicative DNA helicase